MTAGTEPTERPLGTLTIHWTQFLLRPELGFKLSDTLDFGKMPWAPKGADLGDTSVGADADMTIVDMNRRAILTRADMHSRSGHTSWEGVPVEGLPVHTIVRGEPVMLDGRIVVDALLAA